MQVLKSFWGSFKTFAILFSFIVNLVLVIVLLVVGSLIFQIKNGIAEPLIDGLYSSFVGLDKATIDRVIPVRETIPVRFILPLEQNTNVVLTSDVPLRANASFNLPGGGGTINGTVSLNLPAGMLLPVTLDLDVPVDTMLPISLDVRAVIPLEETQLHDAFQNLRGLLEPFVRILDNLPSNSQQGMDFLSAVLAGRGPDLLAPTRGSQYPWPGFSRTAGDGYNWPADMPPQPGQSTGTVPGGLAAWDVAPGAPDGIYIPYGMIGPAGIIPAGSDMVGPDSPSMAYPGASGATGETEAVPEPAATEETPVDATPPADLGIITPTAP